MLDKQKIYKNRSDIKGLGLLLYTPLLALKANRIMVHDTKETIQNQTNKKQTE